MLDLILFIVLVIVGVFSDIAIFIEKELFKAAIALALSFLSAAGFMFLLGLPLIALFQLLILVGGLSTYLIVTVASERKVSFRHTNVPAFLTIFLILGGILVYAVSLGTISSASLGANVAQEIAASISQDWAIMGAIVFMMFAVGIGSILLVKRSIKLVV